MSDGTLIEDGMNPSMYVMSGTLTYALPAPMGMYLFASLCEIYRKLCTCAVSMCCA